MARLEKLNNISWKQPLQNRNKEFTLWPSHKKVANFCNFEDGTKRLLNIKFEEYQKINVTDKFQITSGREIRFPKSFQDIVKPVILKNPNSYFIVTVLDVELDPDDKDTFNTSGLVTINTRIGQEKFKKGLIDHWGGCSVTGIKMIEILYASHIKPWADSSDKERLDISNGLLLTPTLDTLFDKGLISFDNDGKIMISKRIKPYISELGIKYSLKLIKKPNDHQKEYLKFHHQNIYKK
ncbi:restriction endonuclease [Flexistipes sinusarabici DSM 4947]|uniref:Restriction endonuclease n=1 Tax=Flexistipes sinusarabici (strain ATCC 49648 / DSM 4947 / MAS 10) TaxID=717231 RepID=F8E8Z0_FLESM|nr:HNH endonuclease [Flexistipes sinusarabici]AEI14114.1 restriction endonuclease [Flexistipes sinusarabici DSM 4947]